MWNFNLLIVFLFFGGLQANAQTPAQGFALERFYPSAPGGGWFVMDALDMKGNFGGVVDLTTGYARNPLKVNGLSVVSTDAFMDVGLAATYDRYRVYMNFTSPISIIGDSGSAAGYDFTAPAVGWGIQPDTLSDMRAGFDARFLGDADSPFRLGTSVQIYIPSGPVPNGNRADYDSDGTFREMVRLLAAGDEGSLTYAGQMGVHFRPLNDSPTPGSPEGNEFLFGFAAGLKFPRSGDNQAVIVGLEMYEATAFKSFMSASETAREGLLSGRFEQMGSDGRQIRVKLGFGAGIDPHFGAPDWRTVLSLELSAQSATHDK